jgi:hypothetical protein
VKFFNFLTSNLISNFQLKVKICTPGFQELLVVDFQSSPRVLEALAYGLLTYESNDHEARALEPFKVLIYLS